MVQVVTGDSQEEVLIFRYTQTLHHNIYIIIISYAADKKNFSKMYVAFSGWWMDFSIGLLTTSLYQLQIEDSPMFDRHLRPQALKPSSQVSMKTRGLLINAFSSSVDQRCQL